MTLEAGAGTGAAGGAGTGAVAGPATDYAALCQQARAQLAAGDGAGAVASARRAVELLPRGLEGQRLLGLSLLATGGTRPGLGAFQTALAGDPLDVVAQAGVATAQEQIGGSASAEAEWLRTWELSPGLAPVEARLQHAREAAGAPARPAGREPYPFTTAALARVYLRGGLYEHAVAEARSALTRQPERADLHLTLAEALWRAGDGAAAGAQAEHLLERLPDCAAANLLLAAQWQAVGRDPAPLLSRVRAVDPAGEVAARLFGDREAPPPLDGMEGARRPVQAGPAVSMPPAASPITEPPPEAPGTPETAPAPAAAATRAPEPEAEPQPVAVAPPAPDRPPIPMAPPAPLPTLAGGAAGAAGAAGVAGAVVTGAVAAAAGAAGASGGADDRPAESQSVLSGRVNAQAGDPVAEAEPDPPPAPPQHLSQVADLASSASSPAPTPAPTPATPVASAPGPTPTPAEPVAPVAPVAPAASAPGLTPTAPVPAAEPEPPAPALAASVPEPEPETPAPAAPAAPAPEPAAYLQSLTLVQGAADLAAAGDEAMQRGDYITAIQSYGAALRRLRSESP